MFSNIQTWFNTYITSVNSGITGTENDLKQIDTTMDMDKLSTNLSNFCYQIRFNGLEIEDETESPREKISVEVLFSFLIANDYTKYATMLDTYLKPLKQKFKNFTGTEATTYNILFVRDVKLDGLNEFKNNYCLPKLTFDLYCSDKS